MKRLYPRPANPATELVAWTLFIMVVLALLGVVAWLYASGAMDIYDTHGHPIRYGVTKIR